MIFIAHNIISVIAMAWPASAPLKLRWARLSSDGRNIQTETEQ